MPQKITSGLTSQAVAESFVFLQLLAFDDACFIHVGLHPPLLFITPNLVELSSLHNFGCSTLP
jgi:hypothetical protein